MMLTLCPTLLPRFKEFCSSPSVIMLFVYMKCRFSLSYRELEEMMQIRGAVVDHSTLQRWVQRFEKLISGVECANARNWWKAASGWMRPNIKLKGK